MRFARRPPVGPGPGPVPGGPGNARLTGAGFVALTSLQFGTVVVLGKVATRAGGLPVPSLLAFRFGIAALLLALSLLVLRKPLAAARSEGWRLIALGVAGYATEALLFFLSLRHGSAAAVTLLFYTYPVGVSLIAFLTGKGLPGWLLGGALASAVAGAAIVAVTSGGVSLDGLGVVLALASSVTFAAYLVGADAVLKRTNSLAGAMWVSASASGGLAIYAMLAGQGAVPRGWHQWWPVLGLAAFTAGAFVCLFAGLRRLGAVRTSIISATEPVTATILAALFLSEGIRPGTVVGGAFILAGAVTAAIARRNLPSAAAEGPVP
jgi:drug/metabolite transporter (DMT)-like permease